MIREHEDFQMRIEHINRGFKEHLKYSPIEKAIFQIDDAYSKGKYSLFFRDGNVIEGGFEGKKLEPIYSRQYGVPPSIDGKMLFWGNWYNGLYAANAADGSIAWHLRSSKITNIFVFSNYLVALRCNYALQKLDVNSGKAIGEVRGTSFIKSWRLDERNVLLDGKHNKFLLVDTEKLEVIRTYPKTLIDTGQWLHPVPRTVWVENGELMVEGFEDDPSAGPREAKPGISFIRSLGTYEV